jgi:hypothetical protein
MMSLTDFINKSYVVPFVRSVNGGEIQENFFCSKEFPETIKGQSIFNEWSSYLETKALSRENCLGICTDGAPSMFDSIRGFTLLVKNKFMTFSQHIALFTERYCFKKLLEMERRKFLMILLKWLTLSNKDQ